MDGWTDERMDGQVEVFSSNKKLEKVIVVLHISFCRGSVFNSQTQSITMEFVTMVTVNELETFQKQAEINWIFLFLF